MAHVVTIIILFNVSATLGLETYTQLRSSLISQNIPRYRCGPHRILRASSGAPLIGIAPTGSHPNVPHRAMCHAYVQEGRAPYKSSPVVHGTRSKRMRTGITSRQSFPFFAQSFRTHRTEPFPRCSNFRWFA
ncbi:protein binding protein [Anopheles sinensis]|uniref:Protein binding protein n=1 Tax=Anopheles sinensis TaxID=74873 RepID=A0A084VC39_ANOSI|nr:protein binding protein [Anopheles sinensis]